MGAIHVDGQEATSGPFGSTAARRDRKEPYLEELIIRIILIILIFLMLLSVLMIRITGLKFGFRMTLLRVLMTPIMTQLRPS